MSAHDPSANVSRLLSRLSDGELSQSEFEEVEQYLLENPEARQTYFDYVDINTGINNHTVERLKELDGVFTSNIPQSKIASLKPVAGKTQKKSSLLSYIAVAATSVMLLLCSEFFMGERFFPSKTHPEKVATPTNDLPRNLCGHSRAIDGVQMGQLQPSSIFWTTIIIQTSFPERRHR